MKAALRQEVWERCETENLVDYPRPCAGRIPNFIGREAAALRLAETLEFKQAAVVKVHPSLNADPVREQCYLHGKQVLVPPLPGHDFLYFLVRPEDAKGREAFCATKRGFSQVGTPVHSLSELPPVGLVVVASVAVMEQTGARVGKGAGFGELEFGILRELGVIGPSTPVATLCHDRMLVADGLPLDALAAHDLRVDLCCTPTQTLRFEASDKPSGVFWDLVTGEMVHDIGALKELHALLRARGEQLPPLPEPKAGSRPFHYVTGGRKGEGKGTGKGKGKGRQAEKAAKGKRNDR